MCRGPQCSSRFLSTPSARRATLCRVLHRQAGRISIHALREEGDQGPRSEAGHRTDFYPRPPRGGRRVRFLRSSQRHNFYPRPPRGGRQPRAGREAGRTDNFYPRPPRGGRRRRRRWLTSKRYFYPRPPRGGRREFALKILLRKEISIHALREEGDAEHQTALQVLNQFLSTPSARRATTRYVTVDAAELFLSTPSARRATSALRRAKKSEDISIHALREEGDSIYKTNADLQTIFLSTPSARRATA